MILKYQIQRPCPRMDSDNCTAAMRGERSLFRVVRKSTMSAMPAKSTGRSTFIAHWGACTGKTDVLCCAAGTYVQAVRLGEDRARAHCGGAGTLAPTHATTACARDPRAVHARRIDSVGVANAKLPVGTRQAPRSGPTRTPAMLWRS
eukprot:SAG31_NODE_22608_length_522_cov_0.747045_1_plen_146_part_10